MSNSKCSICATGIVPAGLARSAPMSCATGDICYLRESLATPVEYILQATEVIRQDPVALQRSKAALRDLRSRSIGKYRPCLLVRNAIPGARPATVFLMGTLRREPIESPSIPKVYREFCRAIYPNSGLPDSAHFHTTPPWPHSSQWLVSYPIPLGDNNLVTVHWRFKDESTPAQVYAMDKASLEALTVHSRKTFKEWQARCNKEPEFARAVETEWRARSAALRPRRRSISDKYLHVSELLCFSPTIATYHSRAK
ncbi:hypothetical protein BD311DRAFT_807363 [Dichomitus squalens]|uniref:Uncharacterized protein n=1 Tax=Dichomitus squalens TaxID=114155 RepID=A0A4V2K080_9APHY|nr:hypothetical protein BD311DRAFT_807363 [Dichomitus squalens]